MMRRTMGYGITAITLLLPLGCQQQKTKEPTTRPMTSAERGDKAIQDPFNYSPFDKPAPGSGAGGTGSAQPNR